MVGLPTECSYFLLAHLVTLNVTAISWSWSCLLSFKLKACLADAKVILIKILLIAPFFFFFFFLFFFCEFQTFNESNKVSIWN